MTREELKKAIANIIKDIRKGYYNAVSDGNFLGASFNDTYIIFMNESSRGEKQLKGYVRDDGLFSEVSNCEIANFILEKIREIRELYRAEEPNGNYMAICFFKDSISFNTDPYDDDIYFSFFEESKLEEK